MKSCVLSTTRYTRSCDDGSNGEVGIVRIRASRKPVVSSSAPITSSIRYCTRRPILRLSLVSTMVPQILTRPIDGSPLCLMMEDRAEGRSDQFGMVAYLASLYGGDLVRNSLRANEAEESKKGIGELKEGCETLFIRWIDRGISGRPCGYLWKSGSRWLPTYGVCIPRPSRFKPAIWA